MVKFTVLSVSVRGDDTRERGVALTTATIDTSVDVPANPFAKEIDDAYLEFNLQQAIIDTDMDAIEALLADDADSQRSPFEQSLLFDSVTHSLRPNPRARAMTRRGGRYRIRTDHGTKIFRQEIAEVNAARCSRQKNSNAQKRRATKLADFSGNPQVIAKLIKLGDLLIGD